MSDDTVPAGVRLTRPRPAGARRGGTSEYASLLGDVRAAGLLRKRPGYYAVVTAVVSAVGLLAVVLLLRLGPSPWQLLVAALFGVVFAQFGFLAHEAAHRQVFAAGPSNDLAASILGPALVGLSYTWWQTDHNRHHAEPNVMGRDSGVNPDLLVFRVEDAAVRTGAARRFTRIQGYAILPMLLVVGLDLHVQSVRFLLTHLDSRSRRVELAMLLARLALFALLVLWVLPVGLAFAFLGVQLAVFGLYIGGSFLPNHVGMPVLTDGHGLDYLRKQVTTSRNLSGGPLMSTLTGGLSLQIEHHLFPGMARPNLWAVRPIVQAHCERLGLTYTELTPIAAVAAVVQHMNRVGLSAGAQFRCPLTDECGRQ
jgi:fatty acid desaturase